MDFKKYFANIVSVSGLTFISQGISLLTTPILSRIFSPADYGEIAIYSSIIAIMEACASLSYASGIALDRDLKAAKATTKLCIYITCVIGFLGMIVVIVINRFIINTNLLKLFIIVLPIMVIFPDVAAAYEGWLKRCKKYNLLGILNIINVLITFVFSLLMGLFGYGAAGLLIARCISAIMFGIVVYIFVVCTTEYKKYVVSINDIKRQAINHRKFPMFQMPLVIMNSFSGQLPTIIMTSNFPSIEIGYYSKGYSISSIPSQVIGKSVGSVFYQECALVNSEEEQRKLTIYTFKRLLAICTVLVLMLSTMGPVLFGVVLGTEWYMAGVYSSIMAPMVAGIFITQPLSNLLFIKQKQQMGIPIGICMLFIRVVTLSIGIMIGLMFKQMLFVYSIVSTLMYITINSYYLGLIGIKKNTSFMLPVVIIYGSWFLGLLFRSMFMGVM